MTLVKFRQSVRAEHHNAAMIGPAGITPVGGPRVTKMVERPRRRAFTHGKGWFRARRLDWLN